MTTNISPASAGSVQASSVSTEDIMALLMEVQQARVGNLETQLAQQLGEVQQRNDQAGKLNNLLALLNKAAAMFDGDAKSTTEIGSTQGWKDDTSYLEVNINSAIKTAGIGDAGLSGTDTGGLLNTTTKGQIDQLIAKVKGLVDSTNSSQQLYMLRLQSLNGKRDEAFQIMTTAEKKAQDSRSAIINNMR